MPQDRNLELCIEGDAAGVVLGRASAYTRADWAPMLTRPCSSLGQLESEVARIHAELDEVLEAGRAHFAGERPAARREPASEPAPDLSRLSIDEGLLVRDVMTRDVKSVGRNDAVSIADGLMRAGHFRHVVVLDDEGGVEGVVSQRDLFFGALGWAMGFGRSAHEHALDTTLAKEVMRSPVHTIAPDARLSDAARLMTEHKIGCLPVVRDGELTGILTEGDFLALLTR